jgi:hypothetical protein
MRKCKERVISPEGSILNFSEIKTKDITKKVRIKMTQSKYN